MKSTAWMFLSLVLGSAGCEVAVCGDGVVNADLGEVCDDGNSEDGDACQSSCQLPICGDGILDAGESCDDGNAEDGDACLASCVENLCGDGILNPAGESCDDGNNIEDDGCDADCSAPEVVQITAGRDHNCALGDNGAVRCWGSDNNGKLGYEDPLFVEDIGDNELPSSAGDVNVGGRVVQVAAGDRHTCALLDEGNVRCWGSATGGVLGYGDGLSVGLDTSPASAGDVNVGGLVVQVVAGGLHTCALLETGAVRCWGEGFTGALGYGNTSDVGVLDEPADAGDIDLGGQAVQLVAGFSHTCALLDTGSVRCWGKGSDGQLGYGNTSQIGDNETPASAGDVDLGGTAVQLAAGAEHTCALLDTGNVRCWGGGGPVIGISVGQLGYGNTDNIGDDETPASAGDVSVGGAVARIATGFFHTCAVLETGAVRCWGFNNAAVLGSREPGFVGDDEFPSAVGEVDLGVGAVDLALGATHSCALTTAGRVRCWGFAELGQLGYGNEELIGNNESPASAGDLSLF